MIGRDIEKLEYLSAVVPRLLRQVDEESFCFKSPGNIQSKKERIGHLIDCATNNHQTFASFQHQQDLQPFYNLHNWSKYGYYQRSSRDQIIALWVTANMQLLETIKSMSDENLQRKYLLGSRIIATTCLIRKYVEDVEHNLADVIEKHEVGPPLNNINRS